MANNVLTHTGNFLLWHGLRRLTLVEQDIDCEKSKQSVFDKKIESSLVYDINLPSVSIKDVTSDELDFDPRDNDAD